MLKKFVNVFTISLAATLALCAGQSFGQITPSDLVAAAKEFTSTLPACQGDNKTTWDKCFGTLTTPRGNTYRGEFARGEFEGWGTLTYKDGGPGKIAQGNWRNGKLNGVGRYETSNGDVYKGEFKDGSFQGLGIYLNAKDQQMFEGSFKDGKFGDRLLVNINLAKMSADASGAVAAPLATSGLSAFIERTANSPLVDLVVLAKMGDKLGGGFKPGAGVLTRNVSGKWVLTGSSICADVHALVSSDAQFRFELKQFAEFTAFERKEIASPGFNFSKFYSTVRNPISERDAPYQYEEYANDLSNATRRAIEQATGSSVANVSTMGGASCQTDVVVLPRVALTEDPTKKRIADGELAEVTSYKVADLKRTKTERLDAIQSQREGQAKLLESLVKSPSTGADRRYGAVFLGGFGRVCALKNEIELSDLNGVRLEGLLSTPSYQQMAKNKPTSLTEFDNLDSLYLSLKTPQPKCFAVVGLGSTITTLESALTRDKIAHSLLPTPVSPAEIALGYAASLGFEPKGTREALVAFWFGRYFEITDPALISQFQTLLDLNFKDESPAVVQKNAELLTAAHKRMVDGSFGSNEADLVQFLKDEKDAKEKGTSVKSLRSERQKAFEKAVAEEEKAKKAALEKKSVEFPYVATFICAASQSKTMIQACMSDNGVDTTLELKNGSAYQMYKIYDVTNAGQQTHEALEVDLRNNFEIKIQNASSNLVLTVIVRERKSGKVLFQKSASRFDVIRVAN